MDFGWERELSLTSPFLDDGTVRRPHGCHLCKWGRNSPTRGCKCQGRAIRVLSLDDRFARLIAPPGWGKSFYVRYDVVRRALADPGLKFVIAIPRLAIGRGFCREMSFDMGDGTVGEFARLLSRNNLADDLADERGGVSPSKIARIRRWLRAPATRSLGGRVLLVSHAALAMAVGPKSDLSGVHVYIDEAHHLSQDPDDADDYPQSCRRLRIATQMGLLTKQALDAGCGGLTLTTATYFRGDGLLILPKEHEAKFKTFFAPLDLHMRNNLRRLAKVSLRAIVLRDGQDEWKAVERLLTSWWSRHGRFPHAIFFLPRKNQTLAGGSSRRYAQDMAKRLSGMGINVECFVGDQSLRKRKLRKFLGLDSATEEERDAYLRGLDAILTINMFDEGADWPQAELAVDLAPPDSVGRCVQRLGRLLRDEKEACEYVWIYPPLAMGDGREREALSDRVNQALGMMVSMDWQIAGTGLPPRLRRRSYLDRILPDIRDQHDFRLLAGELLAAVDGGDDREVENVRRSLMGMLEAKSGVGDEATLLRATGELLGHAILTAARGGGGAVGGRAARTIRAFRSAVSLAELRRLIDTMVSDGAGVYAAMWTHKELHKLRDRVSSLLKEQFTLELVERCARAYKRKHRKAPTTVSGTECLPKGWRWSAIDQRLESGLLKFLIEMGITEVKEEFSEEMVERCARFYKRKHGKVPTTRGSGTECLPEGWTWGAINQRLENGLLKFLTERGVAKEKFSEEMVERCALVYERKHGKAPSVGSGTECLSEGWTWCAIGHRLENGLSKFLAERGIVEVKEEFSEKMVERCARAYKKKHGKAPTKSGSGTECLPEGWTWCAIDHKLENGLLKFLTERGVAKEKFSEEMVERCARAYERKHGKAPSVGSGAECLPERWTWGAIDYRLKSGLPAFLTKMGIVKVKEEFSEEMVERCARAYKRKHGKVPVTTSGTKCLPEGWTWGAINQRLENGLLKFLTERGAAKEKFSEELVERCARAYKRKHRKAPTTVSGTECLPRGWRWSAIDQRLESGLLKFLIEMGITEVKEEFSEEMVERCARFYKGKHGKAPTAKSGTECLPDGWRWDTIDARLRRSRGGLPKFLAERGIVEVKEEFSEEMVERCARAYKKKHGKAPTKSGSGTECLPEGWTWCAIDQRLEGGLLKFLTERGVAKEKFSEEMVERCARVYKGKYGKVPKRFGTECLPEGWTWGAISQRLENGLLRFLTGKGLK